MPLALVACVALVLAATSGALASPVSAAAGARATAAQSSGQSPQPGSALGQSPAGGAAQPGYDLATGLGSLRADAFAAAVASLP